MNFSTLPDDLARMRRLCSLVTQRHRDFGNFAGLHLNWYPTYGGYWENHPPTDGNAAPRALLALYDDALPVVYGYFVRRCGDRGTCEDLTSDTFLAALDAARKDEPPPISVPWLLGVARHKLADHYRRRHDRFSVPVAELPEPVEPADDWDSALDRIVAESVLAKLPEQHRTVLALRYMDDCSVPECAELIGRTVHATEALLVRARRAFRSHYPQPEGR